MSTVAVRCVLTILIAFPLMATRYLFQPVLSDMRQEEASMIGRVLFAMIFVQAIPFFLTSFGCFAFVRYLSNKLQLDNADALGKEFDT